MGRVLDHWLKPISRIYSAGWTVFDPIILFLCDKPTQLAQKWVDYAVDPHKCPPHGSIIHRGRDWRQWLILNSSCTPESEWIERLTCKNAHP